MTAKFLLLSFAFHIATICAAPLQQQASINAQSSPVDNIEILYDSASTTISGGGTTYDVTVFEQTAYDIQLSLPNSWGFKASTETTMVITMDGNTPNPVADSDLMLIFAVDDTQFFSFAIHLDEQRWLSKVYPKTALGSKPSVLSWISDTSVHAQRWDRVSDANWDNTLYNTDPRWNRASEWPLKFEIINNVQTQTVVFNFYHLGNELVTGNTFTTSAFNPMGSMSVYVMGDTHHEHYQVTGFNVQLYHANAPTIQPSAFPTVSPVTTNPTVSPTTMPSVFPSSNPTKSPSVNPTKQPSAVPSVFPTRLPSNTPTANPTKLPSLSPSASPSIAPTNQPSIFPTKTPTETPSTSPSMSPSDQPTQTPSRQPTKSPSDGPTKQPSISPSKSPTNQPSVRPTTLPSRSPSNQPTSSPVTSQPSVSPTRNPTRSPIDYPTVSPTNHPTNTPTTFPSKIPSTNPTKTPSFVPTIIPTNPPTTTPTNPPTGKPTARPSTSPTNNPSSSPTETPTTTPTNIPSVSPSTSQSVSPSVSPFTSPSVSPSASPSTSPSTPSPTTLPTTSPTKITRPPTRVTRPEIASRKPTEAPTPDPTPMPTRVTTSPSPAPTPLPTRPTKAPLPGGATLSPTDRPTPEPTPQPTPNPTWPEKLEHQDSVVKSSPSRSVIIEGMTNFSVYVIIILVTICVGSMVLLIVVVKRNKYYLDQLKDKSIESEATTNRRRITIDKLKFDTNSALNHKKTATDSSIYLEVGGLSPHLQSNQPESTLDQDASSLDLEIVHPVQSHRVSDDVVMDDVLRDIRHLQQTAQNMEALERDDYVDEEPYYKRRETDSCWKTSGEAPFSSQLDPERVSSRSESTDTSLSDDGDNEETDTQCVCGCHGDTEDSHVCGMHRDTLETKTGDGDGESEDDENLDDADDAYHNRVLDNPFKPQPPSYSNSIVRFVVQKSMQQLQLHQQQKEQAGNPFRAKQHPYISDTEDSHSLMKLVNATPNPTPNVLPHPPKRRRGRHRRQRVRDLTESPIARDYHSNLHNQLSRTHPNTVRNGTSTASTMSDETYNFVENLQVLHEHELKINQVNSMANMDGVLEYMEVVQTEDKLENKQELSMKTNLANSKSYTYTHQPSRQYQYYGEYEHDENEDTS